MTGVYKFIRGPSLHVIFCYKQVLAGVMEDMAAMAAMVGVTGVMVGMVTATGPMLAVACTVTWTPRSSSRQR